MGGGGGGGGMYGLGGSAMATWCWKLVRVGTQLALVDVVKKRTLVAQIVSFGPCSVFDPEVTRVRACLDAKSF